MKLIKLSLVLGHFNLRNYYVILGFIISFLIYYFLSWSINIGFIVIRHFEIFIIECNLFENIGFYFFIFFSLLLFRCYLFFCHQSGISMFVACCIIMGMINPSQWSFWETVNMELYPIVLLPERWSVKVDIRSGKFVEFSHVGFNYG